jgi:hypothetical protein
MAMSTSAKTLSSSDSGFLPLTLLGEEVSVLGKSRADDQHR